MFLLHHYPLSLLQTLTCAICLYGLRYAYWQLTTGARLRRLAASHGCQPVKRWPSWDPFFGLDFFWLSYKHMKAHTTLEWMQGLYEELGTNTAVLKLLGFTFITTIEPENLKSILSTDFKSFALGEDRKKALTPFLGEGIFTTDGAEWQHSRDMLRPNFVRSQVGDIEMFERHVRNVFAAIPRDGSVMKLHDVFFGMTLDVATDFLFGESLGCLEPGGGNEEAEGFVSAFTYAQNMLEGQAGDWGILSLFLPNKKLKRAYQTLHAFVDSIVEKAMTNQAKYEAEKGSDEKHRYVFLHELCAQTPNRLKIRAELLNILLAGRDTTASLLSNLWFELSRRPAIYERLRAEVDALSNNNDELPTFETLKDMKYLRALINESLRLYPIVPANNRQATRDTVLPMGGGADGRSPVLVRKGEMAHWSLWSMHRRKDLYGEDAEEFRPERWLDEGGRKGLRVGWEFLPFNGGPRICIGREYYLIRTLELEALWGGVADLEVEQFALMEASYVTVRLMQEFGGIESRDPEPWREKFSLTCMGLGGCKVVLTPKVRSA